MAIYIRFENGKQVETTELEENPGEGWEKAPDTLKPETKYYLNAKGKVTAMTAKAVADEILADIKAQKKAEVKATADGFRARTYKAGQPKSEEYRLKAEAARRLVELETNKQAISKESMDYKLLSFEAEVKEITVIELAKRIVKRANKTLLAVGIIAGFEANGKKIVEAATNADALEKEVETLVKETETKLDLS